MKNSLRFCILGLFLFAVLSNNILAQWVTTSNFPSPGGGINSLAVSGTNIFAGTFNGGVFLTTDNGDSWNEVNNGLPDSEIWSLAVFGFNIYAGTEDSIFLSTNNGLDWDEASSGLTEGTVYSFAISGSELFAGTSNGVFISTNNGENWDEVSTGLPEGSVRALAVSENNIFAGAGFGVYLSINNGSNWNEVSTGLPNNRTIYSLAVAGTILFAGTSGAGVYISTNNGSNWTPANTGLENDDVWDLAVSGSNIFAATEDNGVLLTNDNGSSWINTEYNIGNAWTLAITETEIYAAGGLSRVAKRPLSELITDVGDASEILPTAYKLNQNYPNPFNPGTVIRWQLPVSSHVSLKVYDIIGNEISTLVNEVKDAGNYKVSFNAGKLSGGVYIYQLKAGDFVETKKMILLR